jgi:serralysin
MPSYKTLDYLPDLTIAQQNGAQPLTFAKYNQGVIFTNWDNNATYSTSQPYAILHSTFSWQGTAGATYDFASSSYFDPFIIQVYDNVGNVVAADSAGSTYGYKYVWDFIAPYSGTYYASAGWDQGSYHTYVSFSIYEDIDTIPVPTKHYISGTSGNDRLIATIQNDIVDGGSGIDLLIYPGVRSMYEVSKFANSILVTDKTGVGGVDAVSNIERLQFKDGFISFETTGIAPQAYRLYEAAFARAPDASGLGFWIKYMEAGLSLNGAAAGFMASPEFIQMYGINSTDQTFITKLYSNVLHRTPEQSGIDFWTHAIAVDHVSRAEVLGYFSESPENQAQVIGSLTQGYEFTY